MYISEWDLHGAALTTTSSLCHKEIYTGTWHSSMYISEWDLHGAATSYYQQLVPQGRNIHPGTWHSSIYTEWDLHGGLCYTSSLCLGEIYTQGHGIPPCIYQNGIYTVQRLLTSLCHKGEIYPGTWHSSMYIRMGSTRCRH
jgi:hypothetical protein